MPLDDENKIDISSQESGFQPIKQKQLSGLSKMLEGGWKPESEEESSEEISSDSDTPELKYCGSNYFISHASDTPLLWGSTDDMWSGMERTLNVAETVRGYDAKSDGINEESWRMVTEAGRLVHKLKVLWEIRQSPLPSPIDKCDVISEGDSHFRPTSPGEMSPLMVSAISMDGYEKEKDESGEGSYKSMLALATVCRMSLIDNSDSCDKFVEGFDREIYSKSFSEQSEKYEELFGDMEPTEIASLVFNHSLPPKFMAWILLFSPPDDRLIEMAVEKFVQTPGLLSSIGDKHSSFPENGGLLPSFAGLSLGMFKRRTDSNEMKAVVGLDEIQQQALVGCQRAW